MGHQLDALGRLPREFRDRQNPMLIFSARKFMQRYRLSKRAASMVVEDLEDHVATLGLEQGGGVTLEEKFCLATRYMATGSNFSLVGDYQGVSKATVSRSLSLVVNYFYANSHRYIQWPSTHAEKIRTSAEFNAEIGLPRCVGLVDGTHIPIRAPHVNDGAFVNRKGFHSLNTMVICDANMCFTHVDPSWAGSVADAYAFNSSAVRVECNNGNLNPFYILGDSAYPCIENLFPPVLVETNDRHRLYNRWHRRSRSLVEQAIGMLKARWRALDGHGGYLYHEPEKAAKIVIACCCLHNIAQREGGLLEVDDDPDAGAAARVFPPVGGGAPNLNADQDFLPRTRFINEFF